MQDTRPSIVDTLLTLCVGGSDIIMNNVTNTGSQHFDYGFMLLHQHGIMQETRPWIVDPLLTLNFDGSNIFTHNDANTGHQYFDYWLML